MLNLRDFFFFNDTATTEIYTLSLHDALPISPEPWSGLWHAVRWQLPGHGVPHSPADRKSTRLNSSHLVISYAVFCLKKKKEEQLYDSFFCRRLCCIRCCTFMVHLLISESSHY